MTYTAEPAPLVAAGAVFIDSRVPDLAALVAGAAPGEVVFVIDPTSDGLAQIAADLAAADLGPLASVSIVAHGAPGALAIGAGVLTGGDLAAHAADLAAIGAAVAPGGSLDLYACDTAAGASGRMFIADLSHLAGGVDVAAATHAIGKISTSQTASVEDWTLDAVTGAPTAAKASFKTTAPFTTSALQSYQGTLATGPDGQLIVLGDTSLLGTYYLNSNSTTPGTVSSSDNQGVALAVDFTLGIDFQLKTKVVSGGIDYPTLYIGSLTSGAAATMSTTFDNYYTMAVQADGQTLYQDTQNGNTAVGLGLAIDTANHKLYVPIGSGITSENGLLVMSYSVAANGTVSITTPQFLETSTGNTPPSYFNNGAEYYNGNVYIDDVDGSSNAAENGIFRIPTSGGAPMSILDPTQFPRNDMSNSIEGLALDRSNDRLYFGTVTQTTVGNAATDGGALYVINRPDTATGSTRATALTYAGGVTAPRFTFITGLAYDENAHVLYVANDQTQLQTEANSEIDELQLDSTGTIVTGVTIVPFSAFYSGTPEGAPFGPLAFDPLSTLTLTGTASSATQGGAPITLLPSQPTITDIGSGGYLADVTVKITDGGTAVSGDVLGLTDGSTFHTFTSTAATYVDHGHSFLVSYANGVLTIANTGSSAGENTIAAYEQVLADVQYRDGSTDPNARTVTVEADNGAVGSPSGSINTQSFSLGITVPPPSIGGAGNTDAYTEGGGPLTIDGGLTVTDNAGGTITGAKVTITPASYVAGDTLAVTLASGITIASNTGGVLTLTGSATAAQYQAVLESVTFASSSQDPTAGGTRPTRGVGFQVSDAAGPSNVATSTIDVTAVNDAPIATATTNPYAATEQQSLNLKNTGLSVSDVDGGNASETAVLSVGEGTLTVTAGGSGANVLGSGTSSVTITGTIAAIDALLNTDATSTVAYTSATTDSSTPLTLTIDDGGATGGGALGGTATTTIDVTLQTRTWIGPNGAAKNPGSGLFQTAADWDYGVPTAATAAVLSAVAASAAYTVTVDDAEAAKTLSVGANAIIAVASGGDLSVAGGLTNGGSVTAADGGTIEAATSDIAGGTLGGGRWYASGSGSTIDLTATSALTALGTVVQLSGAGSVFEVDVGGTTQTIEATLTDIEAGAVLRSIGGRDYDAGALALTDDGAIQLGGGTFSAAALSGAGVFVGFGTLAAMVSDLAVSANGGTLDVTGTGNTFDGRLGGNSTLAFTAGSDTFDLGTVLIAATVSVVGADVTLATNLNDGHAFAITAGSLNLGGYALTLGAAAELGGGEILGGGTLSLRGATTLDGAVTVDGGARLSVVGTLDASADLTLGNSANASSGALTIGKAGIYDLLGDVSVVASGGKIFNGGLIEKTAGAGGTSTLSGAGASISNTGTIEAAAGTLEIDGDVGLAGTLKIDGGATLAVEANVFGGQSVTFSGDGGTLAIDKTAGFHATVAGFGGTDTIELAGFDAFTKVLYQATSAHAGTLMLADGTDRINLHLTGDYTPANFTVTTANGIGSVHYQQVA